jgi:hypothetical protein
MKMFLNELSEAGSQDGSTANLENKIDQKNAG